MWNWKIKNKVNVNKKSGDHIRNSNITIQQATDSAMIKEIYYKLGGVERDIKNLYHRMNELRDNFKDFAQKENEYSFGKKVR